MYSICPFQAPPPKNEAISDPQGTVPNPFTFKLSQVEATPLSGGSVKVVDSRTFPVGTNIVGAVVTVEPGAMRYVRSSLSPSQSRLSRNDIGKCT